MRKLKIDKMVVKCKHGQLRAFVDEISANLENIERVFVNETSSANLENIERVFVNETSSANLENIL